MINRAITTAAFDTVGLDALGPASGQLASLWAEDAPTFDATAMTMTVTSPARWHAMVGGVVVWTRAGAPGLTDASGTALTGELALVRFHPQAVLRLRELARLRFDGGAVRATRPLPVSAVIVGGTPPPELADLSETGSLPPDLVAAGDPISGGTVSFHDIRGLIIDPVAVACVFRDLMQGFPSLLRNGAGTTVDLTNPTGGAIATAAGLATGRRLHLIDLFGRPWSDEADRDGVRLGTGARLGAGPHDWGADALTPTGPTIRVGLLPDGTLLGTALTAPPLSTAGTPTPSLPREFFRVAVVDAPLHLAGNRSGRDVHGVPAADEATRREVAPPVREGDVSLLTTGQAVLGGANEIVGLPGIELVVSPRIANDVDLPAARAERWPASPAPTTAVEDLAGSTVERARRDATAAYVGDTADVVVTWPAGALPGEAFVRVFPRVDPGPAIVPLALSEFSRRGDGASGIALAATGLSVLLTDPFRVRGGARPADPTLIFDLLIVSRGPSGLRARLLGSLTVEIGTGGTAPPRPTVTNEFAAVPDDRKGICPAPVLGLPPTAPASETDPVLAAFGEAAPRESPRLWTMARTDALIAGHDGATPGTWRALLSPAIFDARSLRGDPRLGSPGVPAGPEEYAPGVRVTGALAQLVARAALRRTHHLVRRLPELNDTRWDPIPGAVGGVTGAVLQSVADTVESPELRAALTTAVADNLPVTWNDVIALIGPMLPPNMASLVGAIPTPTAGDRWVEEMRREAMAAHHGRRDTQYSLRWALAHARQLVYIESALLSATGLGGDPHEVDLIALLTSRLGSQKDLRVVLVLPKRMPFGPGYESFAQRLHLARNAAVQALVAAGGRRVVVYHPVGFPGRPEQLRGMLAVVDDVWMLAGTSTFSRRGLTFDGGVDLTVVGHELADGVCRTIRDVRRDAMARQLGLRPPTLGSGETADPRWARLADQRSAFELFRETLDNGGEGEIEALWPGLPEAELPAVDVQLADPDGRDAPALLSAFASVLASLGPDRL